MPRYGFQNAGANVSNAIAEFLSQRELQNRQRMIDELTQQRQAADLDYRNRELAQRTSQQQQTQGNLEQEREFRRATTLSQNALPDDPVDAQTRDMLTRQGYGGQIQTTPGILQQGPELESADANPEGIPTYGVLDIPESHSMRGGSAYMSARAAEDARRAQATEANTARVDAATEARAGRTADAAAQRTWQEGQNQLGRENTRAIAGMGASIRQDAVTAKADAAKKVKDEARAVIATTRAEVRELAQSLLEDPAIDSISGAVEGRRDTFYQGKNVDAMRRLKQLTDKLSLSERGKLKGQGAVSDFEGRKLASSASAIDRAAGPEIVRKHLKAIIDTFTGDAPSNGPGGEDDALLDELLRGGQ